MIYLFRNIYNATETETEDTYKKKLIQWNSWPHGFESDWDFSGSLIASRGFPWPCSFFFAGCPQSYMGCMSISSSSPKIMSCLSRDVLTTLWKIATAYFTHMETEVLRGKAIYSRSVSWLGTEPGVSAFPSPPCSPPLPHRFPLGALSYQTPCTQILISNVVLWRKIQTGVALQTPEISLLLSHWSCNTWTLFSRLWVTLWG